MKRSETIKAFLDLLDENAKLFPVMEERLKREDDLTQDLLHAIELGDGYKERNKHATLLAKNRRDRRECKDAIEELNLLRAWALKNSGAVNQLKQVLGELRKVEKYHGNRHYNPRVLKE